MDFIIDGLATGRMVRILSVVDAYTRECLALEADTSLGSGRVTTIDPVRKQNNGRMRNAGRPEGPCADCSGRCRETALAVHLGVVCAARNGNVGHAVVEQVFRPQFGIRVDQHPVGGLPLAGMTRDRVNALPATFSPFLSHG
jgi:hypothetical protein